MLVLSSIVGVQVGQKLGESIDSLGVRELCLAIKKELQLRIIRFLADATEIVKIDVNNLNPLQCLLKNYQLKYQFFNYFQLYLRSHYQPLLESFFLI